MLKCIISKSNCRLGYDLFLYQQGPGGEVWAAKPLKLEFDFDKDVQYDIVQPTLQLPVKSEINLDNSFTSETKLMLQQKDDDMERHIKSLEKIIETLISKG